MASLPSLPKGTRDFGPEQMAKRQYVFHTIRRQFELFGFQPLETPAMENLSVLTGKYGEEGDRLIYKILNPGDYLADAPEDILSSKDSKKLVPYIADRALRYDLTVPFARFVAMNQGQLAFPFRRYQMQPVWRADRPQKGRYREFYQCDADIIGTDSLVCEAELIALLWNVLSELGLDNPKNGYTIEIKLNSRKVLEGLAEIAQAGDRFEEFCAVIDKFDKYKTEELMKEVDEDFRKRNFSLETSSIGLVIAHNYLVEERGVTPDEVSETPNLDLLIQKSSIAIKGLNEVVEAGNLANKLGVPPDKIKADFTLARGLNYYTGCILEVKVNGVQMGSISGGGRYDNLTGVFGKPGLSGVGVSFGVDRICDVLEELKLYPANLKASRSQILLAWMDDATRDKALEVLADLRRKGIAAEIYPSQAKLKKQIEYTTKLGIRYIGVIGPDELQAGKIAVKNLETGVQNLVEVQALVDLFTQKG